MRRLSFDIPMLMSLLTVLGMILATVGTWPLAEALGVLRWPGLALVYAAGGLPAAWTALSALWRQHILDIDLLMVVAAIAAAIVGAPFEGAVLLTLFRRSTDARNTGARARAPRGRSPDGAAPRDGVPHERRRCGHRRFPPRSLPSRRGGDPAAGAPGCLPTVSSCKGAAASTRPTSPANPCPVSKEPGQQGVRSHRQSRRILEVTIARTIGDSTIARMIGWSRGPGGESAVRTVQRLVWPALYRRGPQSARFSPSPSSTWLGRDWEQALYKAATLLVAASPCAIVISVPAAILSALFGGGAGRVLFRAAARSKCWRPSIPSPSTRQAR